jgi:MFS family permease
MTIWRFLSDYLMEKIELSKLFIISSLMIATGISIAIIFPSLWPTLFGFCLAGFGIAGLFPMTFILAGTSKKYSPGMAISIISTYSIVGMFVGPPLIGYLAHAVGLQSSFITFIFGGLLLIPFSQMVFKYKNTPSTDVKTE